MSLGAAALLLALSGRGVAAAPTHKALTSHHRTCCFRRDAQVTGELSLHGRRHFRTWARLAAPVRPGDTHVLLQSAVDWEAGAARWTCRSWEAHSAPAWLN